MSKEELEKMSTVEIKRLFVRELCRQWEEWRRKDNERRIKVRINRPGLD